MKVVDILNWYDGPTEILAYTKEWMEPEDPKYDGVWIHTVWYGCVGNLETFYKDREFYLWSLPPKNLGPDEEYDKFLKPEKVMLESEMDWSETEGE